MCRVSNEQWMRWAAEYAPDTLEDWRKHMANHATADDQSEHLPPDGTRGTRYQDDKRFPGQIAHWEASAADPDYYRVHYMSLPEGSARWWFGSADFPTREEADEHVKTLTAEGAKSVRVTPGYWK